MTAFDRGDQANGVEGCESLPSHGRAKDESSNKGAEKAYPWEKTVSHLLHETYCGVPTAREMLVDTQRQVL